jgi:hypothetical protein
MWEYKNIFVSETGEAFPYAEVVAVSPVRAGGFDVKLRSQVVRLQKDMASASDLVNRRGRPLDDEEKSRYQQLKEGRNETLQRWRKELLDGWEAWLEQRTPVPFARRAGEHEDPYQTGNPSTI